MQSITQYILQIAAAAILCAVVKAILPDKNTSGKLLRIVAGVFLIVTVLSPVLQLKLDEYGDLLEEYSASAKTIAEDGQRMASEAMTDIIKSDTEAYILSEAKKMNLEIIVEVMTDQSNPPIPCAVVIRGNVSPYSKSKLSETINQYLGISEENMQWIPAS